MLFEHKSVQPLSFPKFLRRLATFSLLATAIIIFSLLIGVAGYHFLGELTYIDAFLNASMILTGMGPVDRMKSNPAKIFSAFYALYSGVIFLSTFAILFAPIVHRILHVLHFEEAQRKK